MDPQIPQTQTSQPSVLPTKNQVVKNPNHFKILLTILASALIIEIIGGFYYFAGSNNNKTNIKPTNAIKPAPTLVIRLSPTSVINTPTPTVFESPIPSSTSTPIKISPTIIALPTPTSVPKNNVLPNWQIFTNAQDGFAIQTPSAYQTYDPTPDDISVQSATLPLSNIKVGYLLSSDGTYESCTSNTDAYQQLNTLTQQTLSLQSKDKFNSSTTTILGNQVTGAEEDTSGIKMNGQPQYPNHYYFYTCINKRVFYSDFTVHGDTSVTNAQKTIIDQILSTLNIN